MGLRSWLAERLKPRETAQEVREPTPATLGDLLQRIEKLELERPAFVAELESMLDTVQEILGRAESKRGRAAALESKRNKAEQQEGQAELPPDRETAKNVVRATHIPSWRRFG